MSHIDDYRAKLRSLDTWTAFLLKESGLPGPRANLELAQAVAEEGDERLFKQLAAIGPDKAPVNSPHVFLAVCGVVGLGRLLAEGQTDVLKTLRERAADPRWRVREGVAMALQRWGDVKMDALLREMEAWSKGSYWEMRAAAAAVCEPRLLTVEKHARRTLRLLDRITSAVRRAKDRADEGFRVLRQTLGYCWSVAVAALPGAGKPAMEKWLISTNDDVQWIMRENLKKSRLSRVDAAWVRKWTTKVHEAGG